MVVHFLVDEDGIKPAHWCGGLRFGKDNSTGSWWCKSCGTMLDTEETKEFLDWFDGYGKNNGHEQ